MFHINDFKINTRAVTRHSERHQGTVLDRPVSIRDLHKAVQGCSPFWVELRLFESQAFYLYRLCTAELWDG
jgi:hypothetical protein